jgi:hypothetical protein
MKRARSTRSSKKPVSPQGQARPLCQSPPRAIRQLSPAVTADPLRANAILLSQSKWVNGTILHYCFFTSGHFAVSKVQADAVRGAFVEWKNVGIGLEFQEVSQLSEAEIRIGYSTQDHKSASQVGRDVLTVPSDQPTTVYGWDLTSPYGRGTALHELGHVLGMEHEHQNPFAGIKWNEEAVYESLGGPPNKWDRATTYYNILEKLTPQQVQGSTWDPDSIMEYEFEAGLIAEPKQYQNGLIPPGKISADDRQWVQKWYPALQAQPTLQPFQPAVAELSPGQQMDVSIKPDESRKYRIETKGSTDAVLVLFEDVDGEPRYLSADDDSGEERNASITYKLLKGRNYVARLRLVHPGPSGKTSLMYS